jgi:hypothetical protein
MRDRVRHEQHLLAHQHECRGVRMPSASMEKRRSECWGAEAGGGGPASRCNQPRQHGHGQTGDGCRATRFVQRPDPPKPRDQRGLAPTPDPDGRDARPAPSVRCCGTPRRLRGCASCSPCPAAADFVGCTDVAFRLISGRTASPASARPSRGPPVVSALLCDGSMLECQRRCTADAARGSRAWGCPTARVGDQTTARLLPDCAAVGSHNVMPAAASLLETKHSSATWPAQPVLTASEAWV